MRKVDTKLFPFTMDKSTMGLTSLWISVRPEDSPAWTSVECKVLNENSVEFKAYTDWDMDEHFIHATNLRTDILAPHIEHRKQAIVRAFFQEEERAREEQRIAKRKAEIYQELFPGS